MIKGNWHNIFCNIFFFRKSIKILNMNVRYAKYLSWEEAYRDITIVTLEIREQEAGTMRRMALEKMDKTVREFV